MDHPPPSEKPFYWTDKEQLRKLEEEEYLRRKKGAQVFLCIGLGITALSVLWMVCLCNAENPGGYPTYSEGWDHWNGLCGLLLVTGLVTTIASAFSLRFYRIFPAAVALSKRAVLSLSKDDWFKIALIVAILLAAIIVAVSLHWKTAE
jgi:hypothetical protein